MGSLTRRSLLRTAAAAGGYGLLRPLGGPRAAAAAEADLAPYQKATLNWRQVAGESITILVTPAYYFGIFRQFTPQFTALTGITVTYETIPPRENREKAVLDLGARTANYASHTADPMYLPLYVANKWIEPLDTYWNDPALTDKAWFDLGDVVPLWREANTIGGKLYAMPMEGETTIHIYRADVYKQAGLKLPETLEELREAARKLHRPAEKLYGLALRGFRGAGQNVYIWPSLFRAWGGQWFDAGGNPAVNSEAGVKSLEWYVDVNRSFAPPGVENWNWPELMEALAQGTLVQYVDGHLHAPILENPARSKVAGKVGYARWPKGPSGRRVTSIWNWAYPINAALPERKKKATWLYLLWLASRETQLRTATYRETPQSVIRTGVNRLSLWNDPGYRKLIGFTPDYADVVLSSMKNDTDADWRPRVPQWPEIGEVMAVAIQAALVKQKTPKEALDEANREIAKIMKG
jgi:multiple sugar transport system substrate-binding protein